MYSWLFSSFPKLLWGFYLMLFFLRHHILVFISEIVFSASSISLVNLIHLLLFISFSALSCSFFSPNSCLSIFNQVWSVVLRFFLLHFPSLFIKKKKIVISLKNYWIFKNNSVHIYWVFYCSSLWTLGVL